MSLWLMDAAELLTVARRRAQLSKTGLAARAGTSAAAVIAYETGRRSPTVATFARLLAACGLQVRGELEPLHADVDEVVDDLLAQGGSGALTWSAAQVCKVFEASGVPWALDGRSAMAAHGLGPQPDLSVELVTVLSDDLRRLLEDSWARPPSNDGRGIYDSWLALDVDRLAYAPMHTRHGFLTMRLAAELPAYLRIDVPLEDEEGSICVPVLGLPDVEAAHPSLAGVLARLRERRTVCS